MNLGKKYTRRSMCQLLVSFAYSFKAKYNLGDLSEVEPETLLHLDSASSTILSRLVISSREYCKGMIDKEIHILYHLLQYHTTDRTSVPIYTTYCHLPSLPTPLQKRRLKVNLLRTRPKLTSALI